MNQYDVEYTDTFAGDANYCWVKRAVVSVPELTHYGYDGSRGYANANKRAERELMKRAKAAVGLTGVRGRKYSHGDMIEFRPCGMATVMFVTWRDEDAENRERHGVTLACDPDRPWFPE